MEEAVEKDISAMTQSERRDAEMAYTDDESVMAEITAARKLMFAFNSAGYDNPERLRSMGRTMLGGSGENLSIVPPFYFDYGKHITVGDNFFANYNCTILDVASVTIGDNVFFAPNVSIYTAGHPVHPEARNSGYEYGISVTVGSNVWVGGSSVILPGVTIGDNCVIGAGSVVTHDIPANCIAAGNPCRVIREITEEDRKYYYKRREFDKKAFSEIYG